MTEARKWITTGKNEMTEQPSTNAQPVPKPEPVPILEHELYHVRQLDRGETPDHKGWQ